MSSWLSWLMGGSNEPTKEQVIAYATKFYVDQGVWVCYIRQDITSDYLRKYLILFMKEKEFQAISTGPHSTTFQQDNSKRRCASVFSVVEGRKRVKFEYYEGDTLDPTSSASVFFQSVLLELAAKMADDGMLLGQPSTDLAVLPNSLSMIVDENSFMNPQERYWVAFLRADAVTPARQHIQRYFEKSRFTLDDGSLEGDMKMSNHDLYLHVHAVVGFNSKNDLLVHVVFSSLPRASYEEDDEEEDEEEDSEEEVAPERVQVAATGDPQLRQGNYEYFHSLLLGLGQHLAEQQLLRSQSGAFSKRTSSGAILPPGQLPPDVPPEEDDDDDDDDEEEEEDEEDEEDEDEEEENSAEEVVSPVSEPPVVIEDDAAATEDIMESNEPADDTTQVPPSHSQEQAEEEEEGEEARGEVESHHAPEEAPQSEETEPEHNQAVDEVIDAVQEIQIQVTSPPKEEEITEITEEDDSSAMFNSGVIDTRSFEFDHPSPDRVSDGEDEGWNEDVQ